MALITPNGIPIAAFDATRAQTFKFVVNGGDQVVGNILTIMDNTNNTQEYQHQIASYNYEQTLPANTLVNGGYYTFSFQTINANGAVSSPSTPITFRTYSQPILELTNMPLTHIIQSASYDFVCQYTQAQNESLQSITFYIYDATQKELAHKTYYNTYTGNPLTFNYEYKGFIDDESYYIKVDGYTVNNTEMTTGMIGFNINYAYDETYFDIQAKNYANAGYVQIINNISEIDGEVTNTKGEIVRPTYLGGNYIVLENDKLHFDEGYQIPNKGFVKHKWWFPVMLGQTLLFYNEPNQGGAGDYLSVELKRGVKNNICYDYLEVKQYDGTNNVVKRKTSNLVSPLNQLRQLKSYVSVIDNTINVELSFADITSSAVWNGESSIILDGATTNLDWMGEGESTDAIPSYIDIDTQQSNVEWGYLTNMFWADEAQAEPLIEYNDDTTISSAYYYKTTLMNSVVNEFYVTKDISSITLFDFPVWDNYTIMLCDFNNNVTAGNVTWTVENINKIKLKRKKTNGGQYVTIYEKEVNSASDLAFIYRDYFVPSGDNFTYAMIPCINEDEQKYFTTTVDTYFNGLFISDKDKTLKLFSECGINTSQDNILLGIVQPYSKQYPVIVKNPYVQYRSMTISGNILGFNNDDSNCPQYNFQLTNETRSLIVAEKREWDNFLCNGKTKIIRDWNGNIMMAQVTTAPSYSYVQQSGNSIPNMSFGVTEVGEYDNQSDLYQHGLSNAQV